MRKNQVEIKISRFGDAVPSAYNDNRQIISIYADSNNLFEALFVACSEAIKELQKYEDMPLFGCVSVSNNHNNERLY